MGNAFSSGAYRVYAFRMRRWRQLGRWQRNRVCDGKHGRWRPGGGSFRKRISRACRITGRSGRKYGNGALCGGGYGFIRILQHDSRSDQVFGRFSAGHRSERNQNDIGGWRLGVGTGQNKLV